MYKPLLYLLLYIGLTACRNHGTLQKNPVPASTETFSNPLLPSGPDPWVIQKDGYYYYMHTLANRLAIWKTKNMSDLNTARPEIIWTPPDTGLNSRELWAPELHFLVGKWYVYYAADSGRNEDHRMWVLENDSPDPLQGAWTDKGKIADSTNKWAIDGSVFEKDGQLYLVWSGWEGDVNGRQDIYIARMSNPWTITGNRVKLSSPQYDWETMGDPDVNEGPEILQKNGKFFLIYSASGCWTDDYALGMLTLQPGGDPMNPAAWTKSLEPVFTQSPEAGAYGPGHNGFFQSPDGQEDWMIYHANPKSGQGCNNSRSPRMQPFTWSADGTPDFGKPVPIGTPMQKPSGE